MTELTTSLHIPHHGDPTQPMHGRYEATLRVRPGKLDTSVELAAETGRNAHQGPMRLGRIVAWLEMGQDRYEAWDADGHQVDRHCPTVDAAAVTLWQRSLQQRAYQRWAQPVGTVEIAERLGVERQTVDNWRQRDVRFPAPGTTIGGRPAWDWATVRMWAERTGRLPQI